MVIIVGAVIVALGIVLAPVILPLLGWLLGIGVVLALLVGAHAAVAIGFEKLTDWLTRLRTRTHPRLRPPYWTPDRRYRLRVALTLSALGVVVSGVMIFRAFEPQ